MGKYERKGQHGRPRRRLEINVKMDLKEMNSKDFLMSSAFGHNSYVSGGYFRNEIRLHLGDLAANKYSQDRETYSIKLGFLYIPRICITHTLND